MKILGKLFLLFFFSLCLSLAISFTGCGNDNKFIDPCLSNPCADMDNTSNDLCTSNCEDTGDFSCNCTTEYFWNTSKQECSEQINTEDCSVFLEGCMNICQANDVTCQEQCFNTYTSAGCQCEVDITQVTDKCLFVCSLPCLLAIHTQEPDYLQNCADCATRCALDQCQ